MIVYGVCYNFFFFVHAGATFCIPEMKYLAKFLVQIGQIFQLKNFEYFLIHHCYMKSALII